VPLPLPLPPFCHCSALEILWVRGLRAGRRRGRLGVFLPWLPVSGDYSGLQLASPTPVGTVRFLRLPSSGAGRQDRQTLTPRPNANKAKRLPRQPSNHSVQADAANNNKNNNSGRGPTESSRTGAGAHQKMTAPNCLIRALFLLQCCSTARLSRWPRLANSSPTHGLRFLWGSCCRRQETSAISAQAKSLSDERDVTNPLAHGDDWTSADHGNLLVQDAGD
jgi:hypothetical protein